MFSNLFNFIVTDDPDWKLFSWDMEISYYIYSVGPGELKFSLESIDIGNYKEKRKELIRATVEEKAESN